MNHVVIEGVPPWDGRYPFDDFSFSNRDLYEIRQICGIRAAELIEALQANDTAAYVAVAKVVMNANGVRVDVDDLWAAKVNSISIELGGGEDDGDPPTQTASEGGTSSSETGSGDGSSGGGV